MRYLERLSCNACRFLLAAVFVFSGYVKSIDPLGTQYKIADYLDSIGMADMVPEWLMLTASLSVSTMEFCLGVMLLFAIRRRIVSRLTLLFMAFMTLVTLWLVIFDPIDDCGCFGDAVKLTNGESLVKNLVLLAAAVIVWRKPLLMPRFVTLRWQWIVTNCMMLFILCSSVWCLYDLPLIDFRPYRVGTDIKKGMEIPPGAKLPKFDTTFILEKNGVKKEFTLADYPDSTWTFVDSKTVKIEDGYEPPIQDFSITDRETGDDLTDDVLSFKGYTFLLIAPYLEKADDSVFGEIDSIYEYAQEHGYRFYCLTASSDKGIARWRDITGAEYRFCITDATTLKTMIRSNPGLILLKNGVIVGKWSHNRLPKYYWQQAESAGDKGHDK